MSLPPNSPRRPLPVLPLSSDTNPSSPAQVNAPANGLLATATTPRSSTSKTATDHDKSAPPLSPRLRNVPTSPRPKPQSMRNLLIEKSDSPELKTRKAAVTIPILSLPDTSATTLQAQVSPRSLKAGNLSPRPTPRSKRSDSIFSEKDLKTAPIRSPIFPPSGPAIKKAIDALGMLLMKEVENQLHQSLEIKLANAPDNSPKEGGSQGVLTEQMIKALGRMDHTLLVSELPEALAYLNPHPEKKTVRFEQLLQGLFSAMIKENGVDELVQLKKMQALLNHGDLTIAVGENDPQIRERIMASFKPYADAITAEIFGVDKKLADCMLPAELIHDFLMPVDHMMLALALKNPKLSLKSVNTARMNFLYDLVITRLLMPLASADNKLEGTEGKEKWPSQLEIWLQSAVTLSLKSEWQNFFKKFIEKSNASLPKNLDDKVNILAAELAKSRIAELQKNNSRYFGGGSSSSLLNVKANKELLDSLKKEVNFPDLSPDFRKFISDEDKHSPRGVKPSSRLTALSEFQEKAFKYQAKLDASGKNPDPQIVKFSEKIKDLLTREGKELSAKEEKEPSRPKTTAFHKTDHATLMQEVQKAEENLIHAQLQATSSIPREPASTTMRRMTTLDVPPTSGTTKVVNDGQAEKS